MTGIHVIPNKKIVKRIALLMLFQMVGIVSSATAGVIYSFTKIANANSTLPAINNAGTVAYQSNGIFTGNGGPATFIGVGSAGVYNVWINDSGQVAFVANPSLGAFSVSRGSGGAVTTIHTYTISPNELGYTTPVIANDGTVTYLSPNTGIFSGNGGPVTKILNITGAISSQYSGSLEGLAGSHNGTLAYEKYPNPSSSASQQIVVNRKGVETLIAQFPSQGIAGVSSIAVNDSGMVAMSAVFSTSDFGLYVGNGTSLTKIVGTAPQFRTGTASINDEGELAFGGQYVIGSTIFQGIFTGTDVVQDKIIQTGDALGGSTVTRIGLGTDALNDNGEVAFWAALADGTSGIYTATPTSTPEPASPAIVLFCVSTICLRRRQRKPTVEFGHAC